MLGFTELDKCAKKTKKKGGKIFEVHKGWRFCGIPQKNYNHGSHAGNKGNNADLCVCSIALVSKIIYMILEIDQDLLLTVQTSFVYLLR